MKESYARQLRIYAAIIHNRKNYWVKKALLLPVSGTAVSLDIMPDECIAEAHDAVERLIRYNQSVATGTVAASPSTEICANCSFQNVCPAFWNAVNETWSESLKLQTIEGLVTRTPFPIRSTSDFTLAVYGGGTVQTKDYTVRIGCSQLKSAEPLSEGDGVRISGLRKTPSGNALSGSVQTVIWRVNQIPAISG